MLLFLFEIIEFSQTSYYIFYVIYFNLVKTKQVIQEKNENKEKCLYFSN